MLLQVYVSGFLHERHWSLDSRLSGFCIQCTLRVYSGQCSTWQGHHKLYSTPEPDFVEQFRRQGRNFVDIWQQQTELKVQLQGLQSEGNYQHCNLWIHNLFVQECCFPKTPVVKPKNCQICAILWENRAKMIDRISRFLVRLNLEIFFDTFWYS